jgi:hypothetical protein
MMFYANSYCQLTHRDVVGGIESLDSLSNLKYCSLNSDVKMYGMGCAYDEQLYIASLTSMGADLCIDEFIRGAFVFEDTFEAWVQPLDYTTNLMKSAKWSHMENAIVSNDCGVGQPNSAGGGGKLALFFDGLDHRYAATRPLDVSNGGWFEAEMFIPPPGFAVQNPKCKTMYGGELQISYSTDGGGHWIQMGSYSAMTQPPQELFFPIKLEIPIDAMTVSTSFKVEEVVFDNARGTFSSDLHM